MLTSTDESFLPLMSENLKKLCKKYYPSDVQKTFSFRVGMGIGTYIKMEKGDLSVSMIHYVEAARLLNVVNTFD